MRPTAAVGMAASRRIASANGTWYPGPTAIFASGTSPPLEQSIRSMPSRLSSAPSSHRLRQVPPALRPVAGRDPHQHRPARRPHLPHRLGHAQRQPHAVLDRPAELIAPPVRQRREELVQQVPVGHVHLRHFEPALQAPPRGVGELPHDRVDLAAGHLARRRVLLIERDAAGRDRLPPAMRRRDRPAAVPRTVGRGLPPRVRQLDRRARARAADELRDPPECLAVRRRPDAAVPGRDPPLRRDRRRLDHHHPRPADGAAAEVDQVPVRRQPVLAGVLAHRRNPDAVAERQLAQRDRGEKRAHGAATVGRTRAFGSPASAALARRRIVPTME